MTIIIDKAMNCMKELNNLIMQMNQHQRHELKELVGDFIDYKFIVERK